MHDVSIPAALIAGLVSFLSPCVLPLVPPYLIYLTGATIEHVANDETTQASKRAVMVSALMFVLGFSTVFVALGASASLVGGLIRTWSAELSIVAGIVIISLVSRVARTTELRADRIEFDELARRFLTDSLAHDGSLHLVANKRQAGDTAEYAAKEAAQRAMNPLPGAADVLFLEIDVLDPSGFSEALCVRGVDVDGHRILRVHSPAAPNAIAAILLALRDVTGVRPHGHFEWSEGNPLGHLLRYLLLGKGDTPVVVREILRKSEPDPAQRPGIHVGG